MMENYILSLCIPTNGIIEWVVPVLESIYSQNANENLFEVVITDNGNNSQLETALTAFLSRHNNLVYKKTKDFEFLNQITCFKTARGSFIKFVNHRSLLKPGSIEYFIKFAQNNMEEKPITYFSTGVLNLPLEENQYETFDLFVRNLCYHSSWSTGLSMWKSDLESIPADLKYNNFFPHTTLLFYFRQNRKFIINNRFLMKDIPTDHSKKGKYNLFYDFAVEYPSILCTLYREKDISAETFLYLKEKLKVFLTKLIRDFIILKKDCSYDLSNWDKQFLFFYSKKELLKIKRRSYVSLASRRVKSFIKRILRIK